MRIGDLLIREGLISKEQLDKALQEQKQNGTRVGYNLVKLGFVQEIELTKTLAKQYKMPAVDGGGPLEIRSRSKDRQAHSR